MANQEEEKEKTETENYQKGKHGKIFAQWTFPEYNKYERNKVWYFWFILILAGLVVFAIFEQNPLLGVIVVMVGFIIYFQGRKEPNQLVFQITEDGISLDNKFYGYNQLKKFWIIYQPPEVKELYFSFNSGIKPELSISFGNQNPVKIREHLLKYLEEDPTKEDESFSQGMRKMMKF